MPPSELAATTFGGGVLPARRPNFLSSSSSESSSPPPTVQRVESSVSPALVAPAAASSVAPAADPSVTPAADASGAPAGDATVAPAADSSVSPEPASPAAVPVVSGRRRRRRKRRHRDEVATAPRRAERKSLSRGHADARCHKGAPLRESLVQARSAAVRGRAAARSRSRGQTSVSDDSAVSVRRRAGFCAARSSHCERNVRPNFVSVQRCAERSSSSQRSESPGIYNPQEMPVVLRPWTGIDPKASGGDRRAAWRAYQQRLLPHGNSHEQFQAAAARAAARVARDIAPDWQR